MLFAHTLRRLRRSLQASRVPPRPQKPPRRRLELESLEARALLSCYSYVAWIDWTDVLLVTCNYDHDTVSLNVQGNEAEVIANGSPEYFLLSSFDLISITTGPGDDTLNVERTPSLRPTFALLGSGADTVNVSPIARNLNGIAGSLDIENANDGGTTLRIYDQSNAANSTYTLDSPTSDEGKLTRPGAAQISYQLYSSTTNTVTIYGGTGATTFNVLKTLSTVPTVLYSGTGVNTVNVQRTYGSLTIHGQNGLDFVNVGQSGSVQNIFGSVHVTNVSSRTALTIDGSATTGTQTTTLTDTGLTGLAPAAITWVENDLRSLEIRRGNFGNHPFTVTDTPTNFGFQGTILRTSPSADTIGVAGTSSPLTLDVQGGLNSVTVGTGAGNVQAIQGSVHVVGTISSTVLSLLAMATPTPRTASLSATGIVGLAPANISWGSDDLQTLIVRGGSGGNTFAVTGTPAAFGAGVQLFTGTGPDIVYVRRTAAQLFVNGQNGADTVNVGDVGDLQQLLGPVSIGNQLGSTAISFFGTADTQPRMVTLSSSSLSGLPRTPVSWEPTQVRSLIINAGNGANTYTITGTPSHAGFLGATLHAGSSPDTIRVRATSRPLTVNGFGGSDSIQVGSTANKLDTIQGALTVNGGGGAFNDTLTLLDSGNTVDRGFTVTANAIYRDAMTAINYSGAESLTVNAGSGNDYAYVLSTAAGITTALHGGGGGNYLFGPDEATFFDVTSPDAGIFYGNSVFSVTFSSFGNLLGGASEDTFSFVGGAGLSGFVYGGGGSHNKLDYSNYGGNVYANLATYEATGTAFIWGIQDLRGGSGHDILVGDDASNILLGGAGRDLLIAGGAGYTFNPDTLGGDSGEDILIAGYTFYDWDATALQWFRDVWAGAGSYDQRVAALSPYLNADTVFSNWAASNALGGGSDLDWFFVRTPGDIHDGGAGEVLTALLY